MSGAVAIHVPDSPIFSSPRLKTSLFCKPCSSPSPSRTVLSLTSSSSTTTSPRAVVTSSPRGNSPKSPLAVIEKVNTGPAFLKRKRPVRIDIPVLAGVWGGGLETPKPKLPEVMAVDDEFYSVYCKKGKRGHMEDRFSATVNNSHGFFGVYDGHGGESAAEFAANNLEKNVMTEMLNRCDRDRDGIKNAVRDGYLSTDKGFLEQNGVNGGACCVTAMIVEGDLVVSNVGDCRAVLCRGGVAEALTSDHQPSRVDERDRVQALGGYVDWCRGVWRIQGSLAITRGIGDRHLKQFVIAEPETKVLRIGTDCEFLILASDGLWDKVGNQEAVDLVRASFVGFDKPEPSDACKKLVELAIKRCSMDDISVMIIQLGRFIS